MSSIIWVMVLSMLGINTIILSALVGYIVARRGNRQ